MCVRILWWASASALSKSEGYPATRSPAAAAPLYS